MFIAAYTFMKKAIQFLTIVLCSSEDHALSKLWPSRYQSGYAIVSYDAPHDWSLK